MSVRRYMGLKDCLREALVDALSQVFGMDRREVLKLFENNRLKIDKTPNPRFGDYGVALHYLFHRNKISRDKWSNIALEIIGVLKEKGYMDKCFIKDIKHVNGYLNFFIDYGLVSKKVFEEVITGKLFDYLASIGNNEKVIVEHTSANPVHPLHVGSGRNSVLGNTFARLLRTLGYDVREHFYVNDMGRQVAILVYGYKILKEKGVKPREDVKIDHWFGAVYALTNIFINLLRLRSEINNKEKEIFEKINDLQQTIEDVLSKQSLLPLVKTYSKLQSLKAKQNLIHNPVKIVSEIVDELEDTLKKLKEKGGQKAAEQLTPLYRDFKKLYEEIKELYMEERELSESAVNLGNMFPREYRVLEESIKDPDEAEKAISELMRRYEEGDPVVAEYFREVAENTLKGFAETLKRIGIVFDQYDWESSEIIREYASKVINEAEKLPYSRREEGALLVDLDMAAKDHEFIRSLFGRDEPGKFVIQRSDGTSLYTTRDVAYSIYKFKDLGAKRVYNVIAIEQTREQKQVKATLYLLGYREEAEKLIHFPYEMVHLKNMRMSGRRGVYYTIDELVDDYKAVVIRDYTENQERRLGSIEYPEPIDLESLMNLSEKLAVANARALLLSIDPSKVLTFDTRKLYEYFTGSWILYTFVRLQGILRKGLGLEPLREEDRLLEETAKLYSEIKDKKIELVLEERNLLEKLHDYPSILISAAETMKPNKIIEYTQSLVADINKLYESLPILGEKDPIRRSFRLVLISISLIILRKLLWIIGIPEVEKI